MSVRVDVKAGTAVVSMDNAPVNAIGHSMRQALLDACAACESNPAVSKVVLTGAGRAFAAGADAREFDHPLREPHLPDVVAAIESSSKPWLAAINGVALGGGAELALACRYRIAAPGVLLGFPEVTLGVVPGAGGTQRLPRLIGLAAAATMITGGKPVSAEQAKKSGLIDQIDASPCQCACALSLDKELPSLGMSLLQRMPSSELPGPEPQVDELLFIQQTIEKRMTQQNAPVVALELVQASAVQDFNDAMAAERAAFLQLRESAQAQAMRYAFFAERQAKTPAEFKSVAFDAPDTAVVVGGGNMGASIAYALCISGMSVAVLELEADAAQRARDNIQALFNTALKRGLLSEDMAKQHRSRMSVVTSYQQLPAAQLAIEAVYEDLDIKRKVFASLDKHLPKEAILATNTSYLDVNDIAQSVSSPERVLGLHFFSPAHIMRLLEIVQADDTSACAMATGYALARRLKKIPVRARVCDGFIGNRILARYREIADMVLLDGSTPAEMDEAMRQFGYAMGPYEVQDLSGLDIGYANRQRNKHLRDPRRRYVAIADRMVEQGRLGRKTQLGWYRYIGSGDSGGKGGGKSGAEQVIDPLVEELICEEADKVGLKRRRFSADEIQRRVLCAMINEAAAILSEGIADSAEDIDKVLVHGYGFPRWRGGLLFYAQELGLANIADSILEFEKEDPLIWSVHPLLAELASSGGSFFSHQKKE